MNYTELQKEESKVAMLPEMRGTEPIILILHAGAQLFLSKLLLID